MYAMYGDTKCTSRLVTTNMAKYSLNSQEVLVNSKDLQGLFQAATEFVRTLKNISDFSGISCSCNLLRICCKGIHSAEVPP